MTTVSAPPGDAPFSPVAFRHLWALADRWNGTWRNRTAAAELEAALQQAGAEIGIAFGRVEAAANNALRQVEDARRQVEAARRDGPDVLVACVHGDTIPELRGAALIEGAALWGETADLTVERVGDLVTSMSGSCRGRFRARVRVRCLNYAEIDRDHNGERLQ